MILLIIRLRIKSAYITWRYNAGYDRFVAACISGDPYRVMDLADESNSIYFSEGVRAAYRDTPSSARISLPPETVRWMSQ